jgi:hypothetical protein
MSRLGDGGITRPQRHLHHVADLDGGKCIADRQGDRLADHSPNEIAWGALAEIERAGFVAKGLSHCQSHV